MNSFETTIIVTGLFVLRIVFPLLLTLAFGLAMNRMLDRWRAEI